MTTFSLLNRVEIAARPEPVTPAPPKVRQVLALLLLRAPHIVPAETLIAELWDEEPPRSAVTTLQTYIYHLRKFFDGLAAPGLCAAVLQTRAPGYALVVDADAIDVTDFRRAAGQARRDAAAGRHDEALSACDQALGLWGSGPPLVDVPRGRLLEANAAHLEEERLSLLETRFESAFAIGQHRRHIADLRALVSLYPLNECLHALLIEGLGRCDRRSEALAAYTHLRKVLSAELGLTPSPRSQQLQRQLLAG